MSMRNFLLLFTVLTLVACKGTQNMQSSTEVFPDPNLELSFLTTRDGNFEVYSMTADGKNVKNLTNNKALDFWSSWSPDGKYILFYSNRDKNNEIYRMDADGSNQINLSRHPANDYLPTWSPDGKKIIFTSDRDHKQREIYTMDADGSNVKR